MRNRVEQLTTAVLTVAAVAMAVTFVHREFFAPAAVPPTLGAQRPPERVSQWQELLNNSVLVGHKNAPVKVIELVDLECPFCRKFNSTLRALRHDYGDRVAIGLVHLPLPMHRFARPAARAAECAEAQGRFEQFVDVVYSKQDSLGVKSWSSFAHDAEVPDAKSFLACVATTSPVPRIEAGLALADSIGADATPTVVINGWRYYYPPDDKELRRVVSGILEGRNTFDTK